MPAQRPYGDKLCQQDIQKTQEVFPLLPTCDLCGESADASDESVSKIVGEPWQPGFSPEQYSSSLLLDPLSSDSDLFRFGNLIIGPNIPRRLLLSIPALRRILLGDVSFSLEG